MRKATYFVNCLRWISGIQLRNYVLQRLESQKQQKDCRRAVCCGDGIPATGSVFESLRRHTNGGGFVRSLTIVGPGTNPVWCWPCTGGDWIYLLSNYFQQSLTGQTSGLEYVPQSDGKLGLYRCSSWWDNLVYKNTMGVCRVINIIILVSRW